MNHFVPHDDLQSFTMQIAERLAALMNRAETEPAFYESLCVSTSARGSLVQPERERDKLAELVFDLTRETTS